MLCDYIVGSIQCYVATSLEVYNVMWLHRLKYTMLCGYIVGSIQCYVATSLDVYNVMWLHRWKSTMLCGYMVGRIQCYVATSFALLCFILLCDTVGTLMMTSLLSVVGRCGHYSDDVIVICCRSLWPL